ncbi:MAG TPA: recombination mediator RecR [Actinomycetota bacterium]|nr:recombination mediator RecR [Actinomycetota bacterium]
MFEGPVQDLIDALRRLPGVGYKSAQRLAFHLLKAPAEEAHGLADAIIAAKQKVAICKTCFNVSEGEQCNFCRDPKRDSTVVCVVEEPGDIIAVERTQEFRGRYHVLGGHISPMDGIGPDDLRIRELLQRVGTGEVKEVILCTNPTVEGEATAIYMAGLIRPLDVRVTRIASGLPVGGDLEYADEVTLGRALEGRRDI